MNSIAKWYSKQKPFSDFNGEGLLAIIKLIKFCYILIITIKQEGEFLCFHH